jgi:cation diffusion facilitator family transporter
MSGGSEGALRAVLYALAANGGIAVTKFGAAAFTGSGAMLAEAIHSLADCANQVLLLLGMRRAKAAADDEHPMGYGRVVYFYAMLVATLLFFVGGLFSVAEGWHRLREPQPLTRPYVALAVLAVAIALESFSLWGAMREINKVRRGRSLLRWFRETRQSELMVIAGEDIAALAGLMFAFVAVGLTLATGNPLWDAIGSVAVGLLLIVVAIAVTVEVKAMITGESADAETRAAIRAHLLARPEVKSIIHLITLQWGEQIMVAVQAEMQPQPGDRALVDAINRVEAALQAAFPQVTWVFFEPDVRDG